MSDPIRSSLPPSDPNATRSRRGTEAPVADRPLRLQVIGATLLGAVLVVSGLVLWRRPPRGSGDAAAAEASASAATALDDGGPRVAPPEPPSPITLSEARVVACHDRGPKVTPPEECDHLAPVEHALSKAIEQSLSCMPQNESGGTVEYVADVSFSRRKVRISLPRSGRSVHDRKVVASCSAAVREAMRSLSLDGMDHEHARYQIAITATYRGKS